MKYFPIKPRHYCTRRTDQNYNLLKIYAGRRGIYATEYIMLHYFTGDKCCSDYMMYVFLIISIFNSDIIALFCQIYTWVISICLKSWLQKHNIFKDCQNITPIEMVYSIC